MLTAVSAGAWPCCCFLAIGEPAAGSGTCRRLAIVGPRVTLSHWLLRPQGAPGSGICISEQKEETQYSARRPPGLALLDPPSPSTG